MDEESESDSDEYEADIFAFKAEKIRDDMSGNYFNEADNDEDYDYKAQLKEATKDDK